MTDNVLRYYWQPQSGVEPREIVTLFYRSDLPDTPRAVAYQLILDSGKIDFHAHVVKSPDLPKIEIYADSYKKLQNKCERIVIRFDREQSQ